MEQFFDHIEPFDNGTFKLEIYPGSNATRFLRISERAIKNSEVDWSSACLSLEEARILWSFLGRAMPAQPPVFQRECRMNERTYVLRLEEVARAAKAVVQFCDPYRARQWPAPLPADRYGWLCDALKDLESSSTAPGSQP